VDRVGEERSGRVRSQSASGRERSDRCPPSPSPARWPAWLLPNRLHRSPARLGPQQRKGVAMRKATAIGARSDATCPMPRRHPRCYRLLGHRKGSPIMGVPYAGWLTVFSSRMALPSPDEAPAAGATVCRWQSLRESRLSSFTVQARQPPRPKGVRLTIRLTNEKDWVQRRWITDSRLVRSGKKFDGRVVSNHRDPSV
jgi:hypothetical protein